MLVGAYTTKYRQSSEYADGSTPDWGHNGGRPVELAKLHRKQLTLEMKFHERNLRSRTRGQLRALKSLGGRILYVETDGSSCGDLALEDALGRRNAYNVSCACVST